MSSTLVEFIHKDEIVEEELGGIWRGVWKRRNFRYELFIVEQIIFHHLWIFIIYYDYKKRKKTKKEDIYIYKTKTLIFGNRLVRTALENQRFKILWELSALETA
jgi:hypothetical protein